MHPVPRPALEEKLLSAFVLPTPLARGDIAALSAAFASEDYDVVVAKNGREAIEHFQEGRFDIALLDLNMPVKGGWEAFERFTTIHPLRLKQNPSAPRSFSSGSKIAKQ